ncbi:hypothetical protein [Sphingomonas oligophenolica]|uniref:hypothetical protein n=1 Tax=Sphingomonas oligophenolica TaxID=301154 RepID=UPI00112D7567|nr:hypothetical protein [Sphingomonas oligophenolica]
MADPESRKAIICGDASAHSRIVHHDDRIRSTGAATGDDSQPFVARITCCGKLYKEWPAESIEAGERAADEWLRANSERLGGVYIDDSAAAAQTRQGTAPDEDNFRRAL